MLTTRMSCKEMFDNLVADKEKIDLKEKYLLSKAIKELKKKNSFPAHVKYEYKIPATRNNYIIFFYAANRHSVENPKVNHFCELFDDNNKRFILKWGVSPYSHCENSKPTLLRQIHAYTSHFFQRYKERFLKDESLMANDVACRYFSRNGNDYFPIDITTDINNNIEKYGMVGKKGFVVTDGFCCTNSCLEGTLSENRADDKVDAMLVIFTTFISKNEMSEKQYESIKKGKTELISKFLNDFETKYKGEEFVLYK